jgi:hypothetical protein
MRRLLRNVFASWTTSPGRSFGRARARTPVASDSQIGKFVMTGRCPGCGADSRMAGSTISPIA